MSDLDVVWKNAVARIARTKEAKLHVRQGKYLMGLIVLRIRDSQHPLLLL